jgi:thiol-disulfide isomerase/thioredoxin
VTDTSGYYDKRSDFWKRYFSIAYDYDSFINLGKPEEISQWRDRAERTPELTTEQKTRLQNYNRELNILVYAGIWCGDCSRQAPMLRKIAEAAGNKVNLRFIERETSKELQDELRIVGGLRVPIIVFLTEDFWELGRFGERLLHVYRSKAAREIGRGIDEGVLSPKALEKEMSEWVDIFERMLLMVRLSPPLRRRHGD